MAHAAPQSSTLYVKVSMVNHFSYQDFFDEFFLSVDLVLYFQVFN